MLYINDPLKLMQRMLAVNYRAYRSGEISQEEYIKRIKPIDQAIDKLEMTILQDSPVLKGSFSLQVHKPEN